MGTYFLWRMGLAVITIAAFALFTFIYEKVSKHTHNAHKHSARDL